MLAYGRGRWAVSQTLIGIRHPYEAQQYSKLSRGPRSEHHKGHSFAWFFILAIWERNTGIGSCSSHMDSLEYPLKAWYSTVICVCTCFFQVIAFVAAILRKTGTKADVFSKFVNGRTKGKQVVELSLVSPGTYKEPFGSTVRAGLKRRTGFQTKFAHLI